MTSQGPRDEEFTAFVEQSSTRLLRYCYLLTGNQADADDLLQASLLKAYQAWERIDEPAAAECYTKQIAARHHVSTWRKVGRRERVTDVLPEPEPAPPGMDVGERAEMWKALAALGERQRTVLVLRFYEDLTEADIAQAMGTSVGTVKSQLHRGLARLRVQLAASDTLEGAQR